jgi:hypothetical protein
MQPTEASCHRDTGPMRDGLRTGYNQVLFARSITEVRQAWDAAEQQWFQDRRDRKPCPYDQIDGR